MAGLTIDKNPTVDGEEGQSGYTIPQRGQPPPFYWPTNSRLIVDHLAAGLAFSLVNS